MENTNGCGMLEAAQPVAYALKLYVDWLKPYCMNVMVDQMLQSLPNCTVQYLDGFNFLLVHSTNFTPDFCALHMHVSSHCDDMKNLPALPRYNQAKMYARGAVISWMCESSKSVKEWNVQSLGWILSNGAVSNTKMKLIFFLWFWGWCSRMAKLEFIISNYS